MIARNLDELLVYQKSLAACNDVSALLEQPRVRKDRELSNQLLSAAGSIPANIGEGFGQQTDRQFAKYLCIARGSCQEMRAHVAVAKGRHCLTETEAQHFNAKYEEISKMLTGLIKYLRGSDRKHRG